MNSALTHNNIYIESSKTLHCNWNSGFFSNCTVTLWGLIDLYNSRVIPDYLNFSGSFNFYRSRQQADEKTDLNSHFFTTNPSMDIEYTGPISRHDHHGTYRDYDYEHYKPFIRKYFGTSKKVFELQGQLAKAHRINFEQTIVVYYRGTDKHSEVNPLDPVHYLVAAEKQLIVSPSARILIQTDQQQVRDLFLKHFGKKCFYFHEVPVTNTSIGIHTNLVRFGIDCYNFGLVFLAITELMSKCKFVICHKGNVAAWICLFRGHAKGVVQLTSINKSAGKTKIASS